MVKKIKFLITLNKIFKEENNSKYIINDEINNRIIIFKDYLEDFKVKVLNKYYFNNNLYNFFNNLKKNNFIRNINIKDNIVYELIKQNSEDNKSIESENNSIVNDIINILEDFDKEKILLNEKLNTYLIFNKELINDKELANTKNEFNISLKKLLNFLIDYYYKKNNQNKDIFDNNNVWIQSNNIDTININNISLKELINKITLKNNKANDSLNKLNFIKYYQYNINHNNDNLNYDLNNNYLPLENSLSNSIYNKFKEYDEYNKEDSFNKVIELSESNSFNNID